MKKERKIPTYHEMCERKLTLRACREIEKDVGEGVSKFLKSVNEALEREKMKKKRQK